MRKSSLPQLVKLSAVHRKITCISLLACLSLHASAMALSQQGSEKNSFGVAWRVIGSWRIAGSGDSLSEGAAVQPGALLQPSGEGTSHSVTILLPDGQRILYECFTLRDCERGFRVPSLYRKPSASATELLARVNAVLLKKDSGITSDHSDLSAARDEAAAVVNSNGKVEVAGLAAALSDGSYSYIAKDLSGGPHRQSRGTFEKHGRSVSLALASEGLYEISIYDRLNTLRIDLMLAATRSPGVVESFADVEALLKDWNEDYQGWPVHEFRRAYLRSVMLGIELASRQNSVIQIKEASQREGRACEPVFEPIPGIYAADTEVKLQCGDAGTTIHYTVDGSQPLESADIYKAPIMVKGTALMIKAFASAPGKKDSAVVTGIYRIGDSEIGDGSPIKK